jgi:hypothetical protein
MAFDEQNVPGKYGVVARHVNDVAAYARTNLFEVYEFVADLRIQRLFEGAFGSVCFTSSK